MPAQRDGLGTVRTVDGDGMLVSRSRAVPDRSIAAFLSGSPFPRLVWAPPSEATVAAYGAAVAITAAGGDRFNRIREAADEVFGNQDTFREVPHAARPRLFGGFSFHPDHEAAPPWSGFPAAAFVLPRVQLSRTSQGTMLTVNAYGPDVDPHEAKSSLEAAATSLDRREDPKETNPPGVAATRRVPSRETWREQVETSLQRIAEGSLQKVVLAQALQATLDRPIDPVATFSRLSERYPGCHCFLLAPTDAATAFGATPERLISRRGRTVETEALAGSVGRGGTPTADEGLASELLASSKDRHEHALVVEALCNQLGALASSVTAGPRKVRRLASVQHLQTTVRARLTEERHVLSLVEALHPTPAVGGLPPGTAQETIRREESFDRGWYAAPVGWFDARGNGEFAVAIRSAVAAGRRATLFAGAGVVADSDPDPEWEELQLKYRPVLDALTR